jgi:hypothetical protein
MNEWPKYVFRGTSEGFRGNITQNSLPVTPTTPNPAKAVLFAMAANYNYRKEGIIYVVETEILNNIEVEKNWFSTPEDEIGFVMRPGDFQDLALISVRVKPMKEVLRLHHVTVDYGAITALTDQLVLIPNISSKNVNEIVDYLKRVKKP